MLEDLSYIDVRDLLISTDIKNVSESGGEISFSCPSAEHFHGDRSPSARMNSRTTAFTCHSCGIRGNAITFLAWHKSIPETVARRLLEERYGGGGIAAGVGNLEDMVKRIQNPEIVKEEKKIPPSETWLENFYLDWVDFIEVPKFSSEFANHYLIKRNFSVNTLRKWQIGYDQISERITIPIRDYEGNLVGFKGRTWRDNTVPKYMILGDYNNQVRYRFQPYQKSKYVFGLDRYIDRESSYGAIIVEGELNVIRMHQNGYDSCIGISGSDFSQAQCDLIKEYCHESLLFLDNDKAGEKGTKKVIEMLSPYMPIKVVQNAPGDAAELDTQTVKELISSAVPALELQISGQI